MKRARNNSGFTFPREDVDNLVEELREKVKQANSRMEFVLATREFKDREMRQLLKINEELREENSRYKGVLETLRKGLECPVCLEVPLEGRVIMCPNGHLSCSSCQGKMERAGRQTCHTCNTPMWDIKCLLATTVIQHLDHPCTFQGCGQIIPFRSYKQHREECLYRQVICPCQHEVQFNKIEDHVQSSDCFKLVLVQEEKYKAQVEFTMEPFALKGKTNFLFVHNNKIVIMKVKAMEDERIGLEFMINGTKEESSKYNVYGHVDDFAFSWFDLKPHPIGMEGHKEFSVKITKEEAENCVQIKNSNNYVFYVAVNITVMDKDS